MLAVGFLYAHFSYAAYRSFAGVVWLLRRASNLSVAEHLDLEALALDTALQERCHRGNVLHHHPLCHGRDRSVKLRLEGTEVPPHQVFVQVDPSTSLDAGI